jgi:lambda family phage portal protein
MSMNILDKIVLALAPQRGLGRVKARMQAEYLNRISMRYDGASAARGSSGWRTVGTDANTEIKVQGYKLQEIARDLVRNNPYAARGVQIISEGIVGAGIIPNIEITMTNKKDSSKVEAAKAEMMDLIKAHCDTTAIDADGRHNLYGLQNLVVRTVVEAGQALVRRRARRAEDNLPLPFQIQVLEPDFLDTRKDGPLSSGGFILNGIEYNAIGKRVAYHLFQQHPGNIATLNLPNSTRVPASDVAHIYRMDRPGQMNGVTWFAPVILDMRNFADYEDAQLMRQKIAACFSAFITKADGVTGPFAGAKDDSDTETGLPAEGIEPGLVMRLRNGESVSFGVPPQVEGYRDFSIVTLHKIAVGLGVDYASLTGDNSQGNFSNSRMGWMRYQRSIENWQWNMVIPNLCDPVGQWLQDGIAVVTGRRIPAKTLWTPPRREMFDPAKDIKSAADAIRAGLSSRSTEVRKGGFDPEDLDREIKADNDRADKNGFTFSSDSRYPVSGVQGDTNAKQTH